MFFAVLLLLRRIKFHLQQWLDSFQYNEIIRIFFQQFSFVVYDYLKLQTNNFGRNATSKWSFEAKGVG